MLLLVIVMLIVLTGSAFCSSSEAALFSISSTKLESLPKNKAVEIAIKVKENVTNSVATLVFLNNTFNIVGTLILGAIAQSVFSQAWQFSLFSLALTILIILFGEILPKNFGERFALQQILAVSGIILVSSFIFFPILWVIQKFTEILFGKRVDTKTSEDEIQVMIEKGMIDKGIEKDEHQMLKNVFNMNDKTARDVMTPRINIYGIDGKLTLNEQKDLIESSNHSRLPVFIEDHDEIVGFVLLNDVLRSLSQNKGSIKPTEIMKPIVKVRDSIKVDSLLVIFQKKRVHIALAIDEFGGTSGIVTLEDVIEEIVGEIIDETDQVEDMRDINKENKDQKNEDT
jgi:CBS domain containing-hemolysin-like protein